MSKGFPTPPKTGGQVYLNYTTTTGAYAWTSVAGGTTDHTALSNLAWTSSGHTGTASKIAGFDGGGAAAEYAIGTDIQAWDANLDQIAALTPSANTVIAGNGAAWTADTSPTLGSLTLNTGGLSITGGGITMSTGDIDMSTDGNIIWSTGATQIYGSTTNTDLYIEASDDVFIRPDDDVYIAAGTTSWCRFDGTNQRLYVGSSGNPSARLHVAAGNVWIDDTYLLRWTSGANVSSDSTGDLTMDAAGTTDNLIFSAGGTTRFFYSASGAGLRIGASGIPAQRLDVDGGCRLTTTSYLEFGGTATRIYGSNTDDLQMYAANDVELRPVDDVYVYVGATPWVRFDGTNQRLGVGNTAPTYAIDVQDSVTTVMSRMENTNSGTSADVLALDLSAVGTAGAGNKWLDFLDSTGAAGWVNGNGAGGVNYGSSSDQRLKTDFQEPPAMLPVARAIKFWDYQWIATGQREIGPTAQSVWEVFPAAVQTPGDRNDRWVVDMERRSAPDRSWKGQPRRLVTITELDALAADPDTRILSQRPLLESDREYTYWGLERSRLGMLALKALQELADLVDAQAATITALEARIAALETP